MLWQLCTFVVCIVNAHIGDHDRALLWYCVALALVILVTVLTALVIGF